MGTDPAECEAIEDCLAKGKKNRRQEKEKFPFSQLFSMLSPSPQKLSKLTATCWVALNDGMGIFWDSLVCLNS